MPFAKNLVYENAIERVTQLKFLYQIQPKNVKFPHNGRKIEFKCAFRRTKNTSQMKIYPKFEGGGNGVII